MKSQWGGQWAVCDSLVAAQLFRAAPLQRYLQQPVLEHRPHTRLGWNKLMFYRKSNHITVFQNTEVPSPHPHKKNCWRCLTSDSKSIDNLLRHLNCNRFPLTWANQLLLILRTTFPMPPNPILEGIQKC